MENKKTSLGLDENIEALLSYVLGWITGIIFLVMEKDSEFVRFHAMQSTITFLGFTVLSIIVSAISFTLFFVPLIGILFALIDWIIRIAAIITWIVCMLKAYQGERFKLPVVGDMAERYIR